MWTDGRTVARIVSRHLAARSFARGTEGQRRPSPFLGALGWIISWPLARTPVYLVPAERGRVVARRRT